MNVQITLFMRPADFRRIDLIQPVGLGNFCRNVIIQTLQTIAHVRVFFDFPVQVIDVFINQIDVRVGCNFTQFFMLVAVDDVGFGSFLELRINQNILDDILDIFDAWQAFLIAGFQYRQYLVSQFNGLLGVKLAGL